MKKSYIKIGSYTTVFLILLLSIISCRAAKQIVITEKTTEKVVETIHDTVFKTEKDSSSYKALLECRDGKLILKPVKSRPGKNLDTPKVEINNNQLTVDCQAKAQELFAKWKSTHKTIIQEKEIPVYIQHDLTLLEQLQIWTGRIVLLLLLLLLLLKIIDKKLRSIIPSKT